MYNCLTDDWNAVAPSVLQQVSSSLQAPVQQQTIRVYLSAPDGMQQEVDLLKQVNVHPWGTHSPYGIAMDRLRGWASGMRLPSFLCYFAFERVSVK